MRALILALCAVATPAAAAEQFDLVCEGREQLRPLGKWQPLKLRITVDTTAKGWCVDECSTVLPIASVEAGKIVLTRSDPADRSLYTLRTIDRISGRYDSLWNGERQEATCTAAPFSGLPSPKF